MLLSVSFHRDGPLQSNGPAAAVERVANPAHLALDLALGMDQVLESQERVAHLDRETATGFGSHQAAVAGPHPESLERVAPAVDGDQVASPARAAHLEEDGDQVASLERADPLEEDGDQAASPARAAHLVEDGDQVASLERVDHLEEDGRQAAVAGLHQAVAGPRQESQARAAHLDLEAGQAVESQARADHLVGKVVAASVEHGSIWLV